MSRNYSELYESEHSANMLQDADNAITSCDLWDWLKELDTDRGLASTHHPNLDKINKAMKLFDSHSGSSYGWTMFQMDYIAKNGWDNFRALRLKELELTPLTVAKQLRNKLPDGEQQYQAMKKFSEGKLSYAEMRRLCG